MHDKFLPKNGFVVSILFTGGDYFSFGAGAIKTHTTRYLATPQETSKREAFYSHPL
jgi:hypothetical protein